MLPTNHDKAKTFLSHHGIKGMRWGVRRNPSTGKVTGTPTKGTKKAARTEDDATPAKSSGPNSLAPYRTGGKKINIKEMSDAELNAVVNRLNTESRYATLTKTPPSRGEKFVKEIGESVLKKQATRVANDVTAKAIDRLLDKKIKKAVS